jgi:uncharacterized membrane protein
MSTNKTDIVGEYLREVDLRLSGLPLLPRRELLADLETHIETARVERNIQSEGEMIEVLERLGSPEVVAAAAYEEAGPSRVPPQPVSQRAPRPIWARLLIAGAIIFVLIFLFGLLSLVFVAPRGESASIVVPPPAATAPVFPTPTS